MLVKKSKGRQKTKKLLEMASSPYCTPSSVLSHMLALRDMLRREETKLTSLEKMQVVKTMARAKVRAFMLGTPADHETFTKLDSVSNDLVLLL
jgi:hypothetical protein